MKMQQYTLLYFRLFIKSEKALFLFLFNFVFYDEVLSGFDRAFIFDYLDDWVIISETAGDVVLAKFGRYKNIFSTLDIGNKNLLRELDFPQHDENKYLSFDCSKIHH